MKKCIGCEAVFEDHLSNCPECSEDLELIEEINKPESQSTIVVGDVKEDNAGASINSVVSQADAHSGENGISESIGQGAIAGLAAGVGANFFGSGKLTFPIFIVVYIFFLANIRNKTIGTIVFVLVGSLAAAVLNHLDLFAK